MKGKGGLSQHKSNILNGLPGSNRGDEGMEFRPLKTKMKKSINGSDVNSIGESTLKILLNVPVRLFLR